MTASDDDRAVALPDEVRRFLQSALVAGDMALPFHYPRPDQWHDWQVGFRRHGLTGESLVGMAPGDWRPGWHVIALNGFDDPFFIDIDAAAQGFPVFYAPHGAGRWDAEPVAPSLARLSVMMAALQSLWDDRDAALRYLDAEADLTTELWREVLEGRAKPDPAPQPDVTPDPDAWRSGALRVTDMGPQKMKVLHALMPMLDLTPQEVLALAKRPPVQVMEGFLLHLRKTAASLEALGATTEIRTDEASFEEARP